MLVGSFCRQMANDITGAVQNALDPDLISQHTIEQEITAVNQHTNTGLKIATLNTTFRHIRQNCAALPQFLDKLQGTCRVIDGDHVNDIFQVVCSPWREPNRLHLRRWP